MPRCRTNGAELIVSCGFGPPNPLFRVANCTLWMAANCSNWIQIGQEVITGISAADFALMTRAALITWVQVVSGICGSRPARLNASSLIHISAVEALNGAPPILPPATP